MVCCLLLIISETAFDRALSIVSLQLKLWRINALQSSIDLEETLIQDLRRESETSNSVECLRIERVNACFHSIHINNSVKLKES